MTKDSHVIYSPFHCPCIASFSVAVTLALNISASRLIASHQFDILLALDIASDDVCC